MDNNECGDDNASNDEVDMKIENTTEEQHSEMSDNSNVLISNLQLTADDICNEDRNNLSSVLPLTQARFPFKRNRLRCVNENRKKRKRLRWQAANRGCHCFDRAFLLAGASVRCVATMIAFLAVFIYATQAIAFEWKPGFRGADLQLN